MRENDLPRIAFVFGICSFKNDTLLDYYGIYLHKLPKKFDYHSTIILLKKLYFIKKEGCKRNQRHSILQMLGNII